MKIEHNKPFEVTERHYHKIMGNFGGVVAGQKVDGKYYIKVWLMRFVPHIEKVINS